MKGGDMMLNNAKILEYTVQIVVSKMSNCASVPCAENGKAVSDFAEQIFNKLSELNERELKG
jgi:hypothetical protein